METKALKLTLFLIMVIMGLFLLIPVFLPNHVDVKSSIEIHAKQEAVFQQVNVIKNRKKWSPFESDTTLIDTYQGPAEGVGARYTWKGLNQDKGSISILKSQESSYIKTELDFGTQGNSYGEWHFKQIGDNTLVKWGLHLQGLHYPFGRWLGLLMPKMMKAEANKGLKRLKEIAEKLESTTDSIPATTKKQTP